MYWGSMMSATRKADKLATEYERYEASSSENQRLLRQEELILEITERVCEMMEELGINRTELASRLDRSKGYVSQVLSGGRNLTLRTLADLADALECEITLKLEPLDSSAVAQAVELDFRQTISLYRAALVSPMGTTEEWTRSWSLGDQARRQQGFDGVRLIVTGETPMHVAGQGA